MSRSSKQPEVGPWAKVKLEALRKYLDYYTKVLKNQPWRTIYVDAFAGGGKARVRKGSDEPEPIALWQEQPPDPEQQEFINGSPRIALDLANPFSRYVFIDSNDARIAELQALQSEYGDTRTISIRPGIAQDEIDWVLSRRISKATHRGVAFLDPFGAHLPWKSIEALAATELFEVLINFPLHMALARLMKNDGAIPQGWRTQLNEFFGGDEWYSDVYESDGRLFEMGPSKRDGYLDRLLDRYRQQLKSAFGHVSKPKLVTNTRGAPLYYLLWAGPHKKGLEGADYVLGMDDRRPTQR